MKCGGLGCGVRLCLSCNKKMVSIKVTLLCCLSCWCIVQNITMEYYQYNIYIYIYIYIITHRHTHDTNNNTHTHDTNNIDKEATNMIVERINVLVMKY